MVVAPGKFHSGIYWLMKLAQLLALIALFAVLLESYFPPTVSKRIEHAREWMRMYTNPLGAAFASIVTVGELVTKWIGAPWLWRCIADIFDNFQRDVFAGLESGEIADHHRVTLYRHVQWCWRPKGCVRGQWPWGRGYWPWSGWLVPVVRAGPKSRASTVFLAHDGDHFEGICGAAFFLQQKTIEKTADQMPNITADSPEEDVAEYAKNTFVSPETVQARIVAKRPCARYFPALAVEVQYKKWGVVMIDSRAERLPAPQKTAHRFSQINEVLGHLLRRA